MNPGEVNQTINSLSSLSSLNSIATLAYPVLGVLPRFMAAFMVLPLLSRAVVPRQVRIGLMLALALVAFPAMELPFSKINWNLWQWSGFVVKEVFIGALIGYAMGMVLWLMGAMGELIDVQAGYNNLHIFDPFNSHSSGPVSLLMSQLGVILFVGVGGLEVFIQLLYESLVLWPPESFMPDLGNAFRDFAIATSGSVLEVAVRLAAPVIGALLIVELGIGLINHAAPQFNTFYFSMPLKAVTALLVLALLLAHLVDVFRQNIADSKQLLPALNRVWQQR